MKAPRDPFWYVAVGCVAAITILAVVLFALPGPSPAPTVTIESIHWQVLQPPAVNGSPTYGEQWINQSGPYYGFPFTLRPYGTFNDSLVLVSNVMHNTYLCTANLTPPLYVVTVFPPLPMVLLREEDNTVTLTISVNVGAGGVVNATGVLDTVGCGLPP